MILILFCTQWDETSDQQGVVKKKKADNTVDTVEIVHCREEQHSDSWNGSHGGLQTHTISQRTPNFWPSSAAQEFYISFHLCREDQLSTIPRNKQTLKRKRNAESCHNTKENWPSSDSFFSVCSKYKASLKDHPALLKCCCPSKLRTLAKPSSPLWIKPRLHEEAQVPPSCLF